MTDRLVWVDVETTGLEPMYDVVLEVAVIITEADLTEVARYHAVTDEARWLGSHREEQIDPVVRSMHRDSGLWAESRESPHTLRTVDDELYALFERHQAWGAVIAGSSVWFDRAILGGWNSFGRARFHYRLLDVSAFHEVAKRWYPQIYAKRPQKTKAHRAMADIEESIGYLRYYLWALNDCDDC